MASDECYAEFTWDDDGRPAPPATALAAGVHGVLAVHSLSKRSNMAGLRAGFVAGDERLVSYLGEIRKHAGLMVPAPVQAAAAAALGDDDHVAEQRARYAAPRSVVLDGLGAAGLVHEGGSSTFYLWLRGAGDADGWASGAPPRRRRAPRRAGRPVRPGRGGARAPLAHRRRRRACPGPRPARGRDHALTHRRSDVSDLAERIDAALEGPRRPRRGDAARRGAATACSEAIDLLDRGEARVAEVVDDEVVVHEWLKQAILLLFRLQEMEMIEVGPFEYHDKIPLKHDYAARRCGSCPAGRRAGARTSRPASC